MRIDEQDSEAYSALLDVKKALPDRCQEWLKDIANWVKDEIDQDPKNLGHNYEHFLHEQTKVFAYQTGLQQPTVTALVHQEFESKNGKEVHTYACDQWRAHLFKPNPKTMRPTCRVRQNRKTGPEM